MIFGTVFTAIGGFVAFFLVGAFASIAITTGGGVSYAILSRSPARAVAPFAAFSVMLTAYLAWALGCWIVAEEIASGGFANRWVLLFVAATLAGAPYHWAQRSKENSLRGGSAADESFGSALEFAGGIQSKIVVVGMLSGIYFNWWPTLPG